MKCYIYCTKALPNIGNLNGKVIAVFELNNIIKFSVSNISNNILKQSCLTQQELCDYLFRKKEGFGWKIDNLQILGDNALDLSSFYRSAGYLGIGTNEMRDCCFDLNRNCNDCYWNFELLSMSKAPQSWCHAWFNGEKCILISIKPKWVEKILRGEKTLEIRKTYPKEVKLE